MRFNKNKITELLEIIKGYRNRGTIIRESKLFDCPSKEFTPIKDNNDIDSIEKCKYRNCQGDGHYLCEICFYFRPDYLGYEGKRKKLKDIWNQ